MQTVNWDEGRWTHEPVSAEVDLDGSLLVTAVEESDAWRTTSYGFVHDSEHGLVAPLAVGESMEVVFEADFSEEFDQAGIFVVADSNRWVKAGVEFADGALQVGSVVTHEFSDWSVAPVPTWLGHRVRVRVSRGPDSLTVRAARDGDALHLVRLAHWPGEYETSAGPLVAAPSRAGLTVRMVSWSRGDADASLH
ncbi:DUF1349 domain-containing protein [Aestuariimicrobium ganziense]|uniref:DUF1349 domain-containing protein n=1 Tax=Aestuariimicrobium ganziense TaxID=2773677 RepID=UPI001943B5B1|nr:DUF1349 domain-containing protein [Aestuariimicrobium ganziense]